MMRLSPRLRNRLRWSRALGVRRRAGTWFLLFVGFSVGVAPIHCVLWSCHVAGVHNGDGHDVAAPLHAEVSGAATAPTYASTSSDAPPDSASHDHGTGSTDSGSDESICVEFDAPGAMTPGSMTTVPAVLGNLAVMTLPRLQGRLTPVGQHALDEAHPPDLRPPRA